MKSEELACCLTSGDELFATGLVKVTWIEYQNINCVEVFMDCSRRWRLRYKIESSLLYSF